jgi:hypothetical protein
MPDPFANITEAQVEFLNLWSDAYVTSVVHDQCFLRRLGALLKKTGFESGDLDLYVFSEPNYMMGLVDRGADTLVSLGQIGTEQAEAFKAEGRHRIEEDAFWKVSDFVCMRLARSDTVGLFKLGYTKSGKPPPFGAIWFMEV